MANRGVNRDGFVSEFAAELQQGRTLVREQIAEIIIQYGYSRASVNDVVTNIKTIQALEKAGVTLAVEAHRSTKIYRDGRTPIEETDFEDTVRRIDDERAESIAKMKQTRGFTN